MRSSGKHVLLANTQSPSDQSYSKNDPANTLAFCVPRPAQKTQTHTYSRAPPKKHRRGLLSAGRKAPYRCEKVYPFNFVLRLPARPTSKKKQTLHFAGRTAVPHPKMWPSCSIAIPACVGGVAFLSALWPLYQQLEGVNADEDVNRSISASDFQGRTAWILHRSPSCPTGKNHLRTPTT